MHGTVDTGELHKNADQRSRSPPPSTSKATRAQISAVHGAYESVWMDFLKNRRDQASQKATAFLRVLETVPASQKDAELWVVEADFWYIVGAANSDDPSALQSALLAYSRSLSSCGGHANANARRMFAETLLRLWRYEEAFQAFDELSTMRPEDDAWQELEAAPFRLYHDAALVERLIKLGRLEASHGKDVATTLRDVAARVEANSAAVSEIARPMIHDLTLEDRELLRKACFDGLCHEAPYPAERLDAWASASSSPALNPQVNWSEIQDQYFKTGIVVVDDFFSPAALQELWMYAMEAPSFRTTRKGFLGAFPANGFTHPIVRKIAVELRNALPKVLDGHPLGLWWLFKYTTASPKGIGIHADAAAVNLNIWLTPDAGRVSGGGLEVFKEVPPGEAAVQEFNREFKSSEEEASLRAKLEAGGVQKVEYRQNRAVLFISDLFHVSEPFDFPDAENLPRVNLTFLFGDRPNREALANQKVHSISSMDSKVASASQDEGWDLFD